MDLFSIAAGAAGVGAAYFVYLASTKGLKFALAWARAKWNAGKADLAGLQGDLAGLSGKVASIETGVLADIKERLGTVESALVDLKRPAPAQAASPAPAFIAPAAPAQA